jgi:hypothetical protein
MELTIIQNKIHDIRGYRVMLDFDLAEMYGVETRRLNESVKRNLNRFPADFMFQLSLEEWQNLKSQFVISNDTNTLQPFIKGESLMSQFATSKRGGTRKLPFVFTEQGVAMLSGLLNSEVAISVNISIMRAFVAVRQLIFNPPVDDVRELSKEVRELKQYIEEVFTDYNDINEDTRMQLEQINETLAELQVKHKASKPRPVIGYQASLESQIKKEN